MSAAIVSNVRPDKTRKNARSPAALVAFKLAPAPIKTEKPRYCPRRPQGAAACFPRHSAIRCRPLPLPPPHAAKRLWTELTSAGIEIDILVNNAGSGFYGNVEDQEPDALERMLQVNVVALTSLTRLALPGMQARRWGRILNLGSPVGYQPAGPRMAAYYASKAYVVSFSKGLARELKGSGVSVTALCPGPTDSSFEERSGAGRTILYKHLHL